MENNSKLNEMIAELNANGFTVYDKYITSSRIENIRMGAIKHYTKENKVNYKAVAIDDELNLREEFLLTNAATAIRELIKQGRSDLAQAKYDRAFRKLAAQSISYASMKNDFADCEHEILGFYGDSYFGNNIVSKEQGTSIKSCFINENVKLEVSAKFFEGYVDGKHFEVERWQEVNAREYNLDESMPVWDGNGFAEMED